MKEKRLLADAELALSSVVANNAMNRLRGLSGNNSYTRELGFDPAAFLAEREPPCAFDLITCVHGLHYVGDKLGGARQGRVVADRGRPVRR